MDVRVENWPIAGTFTISRGSRTEATVVTARLTSLDVPAICGIGECVPYARYGESPESVVTQIEGQRAGFRSGVNRSDLIGQMSAGAARNALDCALWDLEAKLSGQSAFLAAGVQSPAPVITAYTISLGEPEVMAAQAAKHRHRELLKIKLGGDGDIDRIRAVAKAAPGSRLILDANEAWPESGIRDLLQVAREAGAVLVEQPLPAGKDDILADIEHPVAICADESLHTRDHLGELKSRYDCINIKLDKAGGLSEALELQKAARREKLGIMIGCMVGTSLAMAPAMVLAQDADFVDLDGPLLLAKDRPHGLLYRDSSVFPPTADLWG